MTRLGLLVALALPLAAGGCALPSGNEISGEPINSCESDSDCGEDAACEAARCVATSYDLAGMLLVVRPESGGAFAPGASFVVDPSSTVTLVSEPGTRAPLGANFPVNLPPLVSLQDSVVALDPSSPSACGGPDGSVPATVTFYRSPKRTGLPAGEVVATTNLGGPTYSFDVDLVSGPDDTYDVYVEPIQLPGCEPALPPYLLPGQSYGPATSKILVSLPPSSTLGGTVAGAMVTAGGWDLEIAEPARGLPLSPDARVAKGSGAFSLDFAPPLDPSTSPILVLSNAGVGTARVFWSYASTVNLSGASTPSAALAADLASPVEIRGTVLSADGSKPIDAQLVIQSLAITSDDVSQNASVALSTSTNVSPPTPEDVGSYSVSLAPGDYVIRAFPVDEGTSAITDFVKTVPPTGCPCEENLQLDAKVTWSGSLLTATGVPVTSTPVAIVASTSPPTTFLESTHALAALPPRQVQSTSDDSGNFSLQVDQGLADILVQPDPATNLPWLVVPSRMPGSVVSPLSLRTPAFLDGIVKDPTGSPVVGAVVEAWLPVPTSGTGLSGTAVRIGAATTDANGAYTLVLPSRI